LSERRNRSVTRSRVHAIRLLLLEQEHISTNNDILLVFIGESSVGAGILRHSDRTLPAETGKETGNGYRPILGSVHLPFASNADLTLIRRG